MHAPTLPSAETIRVDTRGAVILKERSPQTKDSRGIYLPNYIEPVSHIAVDVGGSLAKVVYFTRSPNPPLPVSYIDVDSSHASASELSSLRPARIDGALTPMVLETQANVYSAFSGVDDAVLQKKLQRATLPYFPGGSLNFERFETDNVDDCVTFIRGLIKRSAEINHVSVDEMRKGVQIMMTGGGAQKFYELFSSRLDVEVCREDEMECLINGLNFITLIPDEVYYFSDALVHQVSHAGQLREDENLRKGDEESYGVHIYNQSHREDLDSIKLERPSPDPPKYAVTFEPHPKWQLPCLLVNIGSGVSIIKVDGEGKYERVSGTSLGGGTLWGLLSLLTPAKDFDEMLSLSERGDNATVDMLVGDIYGQDYSRLGLKSTTIASSFGKVFKRGVKSTHYSPEDISKSLLYAISNNIGQIAYMNAEKYNFDRIYFSGYFIRGHAATIATLSYAIRFWSKGSKRALFLRHEGFLGAIGAWIKSIEYINGDDNK